MPFASAVSSVPVDEILVHVGTCSQLMSEQLTLNLVTCTLPKSRVDWTKAGWLTWFDLLDSVLVWDNFSLQTVFLGDNSLEWLEIGCYMSNLIAVSLCFALLGLDSDNEDLADLVRRAMLLSFCIGGIYFGCLKITGV